MKNGIIAGSIILAGIGGLTLLNNNSDIKNSTERSTYSNVNKNSEYFVDRNCDDFSSQNEAQLFFESEGGPLSDRHGLDRDNDGIVCENLK
jgi:hypothetical protein